MNRRRSPASAVVAVPLCIADCVGAGVEIARRRNWWDPVVGLTPYTGIDSRENYLNWVEAQRFADDAEDLTSSPR